MLNVPLRSPPVPHVSSTGTGVETGCANSSDGAGEPVELVDGLALGPEGHQESADLAGGHVARHDRPHRRGGLLGRQRLVRHETLQCARPEVRVGLDHEGPHASSCACLGPGGLVYTVASPPPAVGKRGCGSMAERELPKLETGVRFPSPALFGRPRPRARTQRRPVDRTGSEVARRRRTDVLQGTDRAPRRRRLADLATETDQRHVQRRAKPARDQLVQDPVRSLRGGLRGDEPEPPRHAVHVRVHGHRVATQREGEHDGGRLRARRRATT